MKERRVIYIKHIIFVVLMLFIVCCASKSYGIRWERILGGRDIKLGRSIQQTTHGGYIITGSIQSSGEESDVYLVKTDAEGEKLWSKTLGGP
jgi:hypothetical protein